VNHILAIIEDVVQDIAAAAQETERYKSIEALFDTIEVKEMSAEYESGQNENILKPLLWPHQPDVINQCDLPLQQATER
jgi:hypothetical protein